MKPCKTTLNDPFWVSQCIITQFRFVFPVYFNAIFSNATHLSPAKLMKPLKNLSTHFLFHLFPVYYIYKVFFFVRFENEIG